MTVHNEKNSNISFPCLTRESRNKDINSMNKDFNSDWIFGSKPEYDRRKSKSENDKRIESGRSMVEMLGVLAVIGVLSIGGVAGYSYGMDKYRANETTNQIMLRAIDLMTQAAQGNETLSLAGWANEQTQYDFTTPDYTDDGLIVFDIGTTKPLPKHICEIVYDAMKDIAVQIDINAVRADSNATCGDDNEMTFYFEGGIGGTCDPACPEGQYCDNGICFKGGVPEMTKAYNKCSYGDDCGTCRSCQDYHNGAGMLCYAETSGTCIIDDQKGICKNGQCYPTGCTTNDDCTEPNTYCASTNSSSTERFPDSEKGSCAPIDFVRYEGKDGNTYYISNMTVSWWDAEFACDAIGANIKMVNAQDLVTESDDSKWEEDTGYHKQSFLAKDLYAFIGERWIWTQNLGKDSICGTECAVGIHLGTGNVYDHFRLNYHALAVCK